ncbi:MAG: 3-demethylubiquinone-9 3-methyltransferase [Rhodospirillales bacterium]|jgi:PhnB protein|nr:3-demethylubiquinone-9 3-methyltransferase [Rhodospirillales bacterium]
MKIQPYLFFNGRCDEAIDFYGRTLGATVTELMRFKESKETMESGYVPADFADKVMHSSIRIGEQEIMASDGMTKEKQNFQGVSLTISVDNDAEADRVFTALGDGGQVQMPMDKTFFASRFGMVADRFGVSWMVMSPL